MLIDFHHKKYTIKHWFKKIYLASEVREIVKETRLRSKVFSLGSLWILRLKFYPP